MTMPNKVKLYQIIPLLLCIAGCEKLNQSSEIGAKACSNKETYKSLKTIVFNNAKDANHEDPVLINDWLNSFVETVDMPRVVAIDKDTNRTDCAGSLILNIPAPSQKYFDGNTKITSQVTYSVQPSADGEGVISTLNDYETLVQEIVGANAFAIAEKKRKSSEALNAAVEAKTMSSSTTKPSEDVYYYTSGDGIQYKATTNTNGFYLVADKTNETLSLGKSCDAHSSKFGNGKWGWANGGFIAEFQNGNSIGFGRQADFPDTEKYGWDIHQCEM